MSNDFATLRREYAALWATMTIDPPRESVFQSVVRKMQAGMPQYRAVERATGVPASVIAVIHQRESGGNFATHLHNGDPLNARTVHVPAGRPPKGAPPFTWQDSAIDALEYEDLDAIHDWSVERAAFVLEGYNGFGYRNHGVRSPYLWGGSNQQQTGKYVADGKFNPDVIDVQLGCMPLLRKLWDMSPELALLPAADQPPNVVVPLPRSAPAPAPPVVVINGTGTASGPTLPPPPTVTPVQQGAIAAAIAALAGGILMFGQAVTDWFAHLFN